MSRVFSYVSAVVLGVSVANRAQAQTAQQNAQFQQALQNYLVSERVLGMNDSCEVLGYDAISYANLMIRDNLSPLRQVMGDKLDGKAEREKGRVAFEGCKSRAEAPDDWAMIDYIRNLSAASVVAASKISSDPAQCTKDTFRKIAAQEFKAAAENTLASVSADRRQAVAETGGNMATYLDKACEEPGQFGYPSEFRPAVAKIEQLRQYRLSAAGKADNSLPPAPEADSFGHDVGVTPWRSLTTYGQSYTPDRIIYAYRSFEPSPVVALFKNQLGSGLGGGSSTVYFTREGEIRAYVADKDWNEIMLRSAETGEFYHILRSNPDAKPDFFGNNPALFKMAQSERDRMMRENDENSELHIYYRESAKSPPKAYRMKWGDEWTNTRIKLGDFLRAYKWSMAPSALD